MMKNNKKKAQTSLEFLMTYGWAILIIIVVLVIAWQWGLFQQQGRISPGYSGFWGVVLGDFSFNSEGLLRLSIQNEINARVNLTKINVTIEGDKYSDSSLNVQLDSGGRYTWSRTFSPRIPAGQRFEAFVSIDYKDERTSETYRSSGMIWGNVESA